MSEINRNFIYQLTEKGKRIDNRAPNEYRPIRVEKSVVETAEGSARVYLGNTVVLVGVKIGLGEPFPDTPQKGVLTTNAELVPMASPTFESGPPREGSIELARVVDRGIRESGTLDLEKLCLEEGEKVWVVFIDIHVLDYDGNLFDASALGALAALTNTTVPASRFELGEDFKLPIMHYPIACTTIKVENSLLVDPSLEEEKVACARLTVTTDENGDIRAMQKGLGGSFTLEQIKNIVTSSQELAKVNRKYVLD
ncbi:MAG: exosome complex protein Rrp42 [Methanomassiliicoccales archaeon]|nr:MAG: exosome complex protein Rrp42 [Methanomassiliicoccales archaeon]